MSSTENTIPIEAWNTVLFDKFCRFRNVLTHGLSDHSDRIISSGTPIPKAAAFSMWAAVSAIRRQQIAKQVGPSGSGCGRRLRPEFYRHCRTRSAGGQHCQRLILCSPMCRSDDLSRSL